MDPASIPASNSSVIDACGEIEPQFRTIGAYLKLLVLLGHPQLLIGVMINYRLAALSADLRYRQAEGNLEGRALPCIERFYIRSLLCLGAPSPRGIRGAQAGLITTWAFANA